jgi:hypothetical protein
MKHARWWMLGMLILGEAPAIPAETSDFDTRLVLSTVKVSTPDSSGTAFVLRQAAEGESGRPRFLLVTAEHVLGRTKDDAATLIFHRRKTEGGFAKLPKPVRVRQNGRALWTRHPSADVAVMELVIPADVVLPGVAVELLADDADLERHEVHPGDLIKCVGYPHANLFEANEAGFALVRLGCIASFPLLPTRTTRTFLADFNTFEGDSGAPVYLTDVGRRGGEVDQARGVRLILGLVSGQHFVDEEFKMVYQSGKFRHRMGLGIVVHASAIRETIDRMPRRP